MKPGYRNFCGALGSFPVCVLAVPGVASAVFDERADEVQDERQGPGPGRDECRQASVTDGVDEFECDLDESQQGCDVLNHADAYADRPRIIGRVPCGCRSRARLRGRRGCWPGCRCRRISARRRPRPVPERPWRVSSVPV